MKEIRKFSADEQSHFADRSLTTSDQPRFRVEAYADDISSTCYMVSTFASHDKNDIAKFFAMAVDKDNFRVDDVARGLRKISYSDASFAKSIKQPSAALLSDTRDDSTTLANVIKRSDGIEVVRKNIPVMTYEQAIQAVDSELSAMKRQHLVVALSRYGIAIDELAAHRDFWRIRREIALEITERQLPTTSPTIAELYLRHLEHHVSKATIADFRQGRFEQGFQVFERTTDIPRHRDDFETSPYDSPETDAYVHTTDAPTHFRAKETKIHLSRDPDGDKQRVQFIRPTTPWVARPHLAWQTTLQLDGSVNRTLLFGSRKQYYDSIDQVVVHPSMQLGLLALHTTESLVDPRTLQNRTRQYFERGSYFRRFVPDYHIGSAGVALVELLQQDGLPEKLTARLQTYEALVG